MALTQGRCWVFCNFQIWRLRNAIFSTCHEVRLRKIDLEYENGKQLQVTAIKITESKENKSIHRIDRLARSVRLVTLIYSLVSIQIYEKQTKLLVGQVDQGDKPKSKTF